MPKVVAIIQARNGNTRLPNKGSVELLGKPMLHHVIERVKRATKLDEIVVAMPGAEEDIPLMNVAADLSTHVFIARVREIADEDIVGRYAICAGEYEANLIVRIAADNPCIEASEIDSLVTDLSPVYMLLRDNAENLDFDYDGFGGELYTFDMLKWMDETIKHPFYREQPHRFWYDIQRYEYVGKRFPAGFRLDVNTPAEYEKIKTIYEHFGHNHFSVQEVMEFLGTENLEKRPTAS